MQACKPILEGPSMQLDLDQNYVSRYDTLSAEM